MSIEQAYDFFDEGRYDESQAICIALLECDINYFPANYLLGNIKCKLGDYEAAINFYRRALILRPTSGVILFNLAFISKEKEDTKGALDYINKYININDKDAEAYVFRSTLRIEAADFALALEDLDAALRINSNLSEAFVNKGNCFREMTRFDEALASYNIAVSIESDYAEAFNNRGVALGELRPFDAVKVQCELSMPTKTISLLYTTARPHLIPEVIGRWFERDPNEIEMIVVTDEPYPATVFPGVKFLVNSGKRDCVTGWNLAAQHSRGDIIVQVSDDLYPPTEWAELIRGFIKEASKIRKDIVLNLMDERQVRDAVYHPVLTREAYEKLSYLYPPDFESMFCDNWFSAYHVKYSHFLTSNGIFWCHRHRTVYKVEVDDVMRVHESPERYEKGRATFLKYVKKHRLDRP